MKLAAILLLSLFFHPSSEALPACARELKEELARHRINFESGVTEAQDSDKLLDEYLAISNELYGMEDDFQIPPKPERHKFKTEKAFNKDLETYLETLPDMKATRERLLAKKYPRYKTLKTAEDKFSPEKNEVFSDLVKNNQIGYDQILHFKKEDRTRVDAYVKNGRINSFRTLFPDGDRDYVLLTSDCKPDIIILKHLTLTDTLKDELCDELPRLRSLIEAAEKNPAKLNGTAESICEFQGGRLEGGQCRCQPGPENKKGLFEVIYPYESSDSPTCFESPAVLPAKTLQNFAEAKLSHVEPSHSSYVAIERACKRYFNLPSGPVTPPPSPSRNGTAR